MKTKKCSKCGKRKATTEFYQNKAARDGLRSACKTCRKRVKTAYRMSKRGRNMLAARQKMRADSGYLRYGRGAIASLRRSARRRDLTFDLTTEQLTKWWKTTPDKCAYCRQTIEKFIGLRKQIVDYKGSNWEIAKYQRFFRNPRHRVTPWLTIDRINNARGYTVTNLAKACWICNSLKNDFFSATDMKRIAPTLIRKLGREIEKEQLPTGT